MLTTAQKATVKADIAANSDLNSQPAGSDGAFAIAALYNLPAAVDYWVWRSFVPDRDIYEVTTADATVWSWTIYVGRSQGERDAWRQMVNMAGGLNPSLANVRAGISDIFSGAGAGGAAQRTHILTIGRRKATRIEKLLATATAGGAGQRGSTANPDTLGVESPLSKDDMQDARES